MLYMNLHKAYRTDLEGKYHFDTQLDKFYYQWNNIFSIHPDKKHNKNHHTIMNFTYKQYIYSKSYITGMLKDKNHIDNN